MILKIISITLTDCQDLQFIGEINKYDGIKLTNENQQVTSLMLSFNNYFRFRFLQTHILFISEFKALWVNNIVEYNIKLIKLIFSQSKTNIFRRFRKITPQSENKTENV